MFSFLRKYKLYFYRINKSNFVYKNKSMPNKRLVTNWIGQGDTSSEQDDNYEKYSGEEEESSFQTTQAPVDSRIVP